MTGLFKCASRSLPTCRAAISEATNDGDPCRFGVHADEPKINGEEPPYARGVGYPPYVHAVRDLVYSFEKDNLEAAYGDGVRVTVRRDGTTQVDDYDCGY